MKKNQNKRAHASEVRRQAEERLKRQKPEAVGRRGAVDTARLVHELQVHQIELEMQNDELRRARQELERSREKYVDLYDLAPVGYLTLSEKGLILEANLTTTRLLGVARYKLLKQPLACFIVREDVGIYHRHRRQLLETRAPQGCELRLTRKDGTPFWAQLDAIVTLDAVDAAPVCRTTLSDITGHKRAEADRERLAQFERLAQLMKRANDIILLADEHGRILEANDRALETYGYSPAELRQRTVADLRAPASRAEFPQHTKRLETDGRAVFEAVHQRRDGSEFPVEISARFIEIAGVRRRMSIVRDITRRKQAEQELRQSKERFHTLVSATNDIVWHSDAQGEPIGENLSWRQFTGQTFEDIRAGRWIEAVHPDDRPTVEAVVSRALAEGTPYEIENRLKRFDGEWRHMLVRGVPIRRTDATVLEWVGACQDITERKQAEKRMQMFFQEIIAAREEERKRVSAALHHDVGSLAVGISALLDAIEDGLRSGKPGKALQRMKRTRKLFEESVVRLKTLAVQIRPPELDVLGLRAALRQHFSQVTKHGRARIHFRETLGRRQVFGDTATILFRVAQEALTNAITHGHAKRVDVRISASKEEVSMTVRDNGTGFDPSEQRTQETPQMGLRVMQEMAVLAGGAFTVDSGRGKGTTVRLSLPLAAAAVGPAGITVREETAALGEMTRNAGGGARPRIGDPA